MYFKLERGELFEFVILRDNILKLNNNLNQIERIEKIGHIYNQQNLPMYSADQDFLQPLVH